MDTPHHHYEVDFEPVGRRGKCSEDDSLLDASRQFGVDLLSTCGGGGICGDCKVQILEGSGTPVTFAEEDMLLERELEEGYRLACQVSPQSDCKVRVPAESLSTPMRTQVEGREIAIDLNPAVLAVTVDMPRPSLEHPLADADSLLKTINEQHGLDVQSVDINVLRSLSDKLRDWEWQVEAYVRGSEVIAIGPAGAPPLGFAVDLGSTKVAGYLVDISTGETLAAQGLMNPQISYGEDIISRITYAMKRDNGREDMQRLVVEGLNELAASLCEEVGASPDAIVDAVIVGNTAMHHLLLGLPVQQLALSPFVATISDSVDVKTRDMGLNFAPGAYLHIPPNIAGFVGSDHVAMLLATEERWKGKNVVALDIGTNTEISLVTADGQTHFSVSCASGPAFEGYQIKDGTRAKAGAIERVLLTGDDLYIETIENAPPAGICGSGILDAIAQLSLAGVVNETGRMQEGSHERVRMDSTQLEFLLAESDTEDGHREITVTQHDVRSIQLAKGSIQAGIDILIAESGLTAEDLDEIIIAGAFGSFIDVKNAIAIGMFPALPLDKFDQVGNAAGMGAKLALLSTDMREHAREMYGHIGYIELAKYPSFASIFAHDCMLKPYTANA